MTYTFARAGAEASFRVEGYFSRKQRWWLDEKKGKLNEMHYDKPEEYLDAYLKAGIAGDRKGPPLRAAICCHTLRARGTTDYLTNVGRIELPRRIAGHSDAKTSGLYGRRNDDCNVGEVERIGT
jgi:integrase/recombinase XerD